MESLLLTSPMTSRHVARQIPGFPSLTPEQLAQIDFENKANLAILVWVVSGVVISLITIVVTLRLVVRRRTTGRLFIDDVLISLATVFTLVVCSIAIAATRYGLGRHIWNLDLATILDNIKNCVQLMFVGNIFYSLAIAFTKLSIVASYMNIFSPTGVMRWILYVTAAVTIGLLLASIPATIFQCHPIAAAWDFTLSQAGCYKFVHFLYASTAVNITTDLILCTVAIPYVWRLQLPVQQKMLISFLFFIGGFACVASIIRVAYLHLIDNGNIDITFNLVSSLMWTIAECAIGIICVSIPCLRPLLARLLPSLFRLPWTQKSSHSSRPRAQGSTSKLSANRIDESIVHDEIELVTSSRRDSWVILPDPEAHVDAIWDRKGHA